MKSCECDYTLARLHSLLDTAIYYDIINIPRNVGGRSNFTHFKQGLTNNVGTKPIILICHVYIKLMHFNNLVSQDKMTIFQECQLFCQANTTTMSRRNNITIKIPYLFSKQKPVSQTYLFYLLYLFFFMLMF
jgi:hypothetical protein